MTYSNLQKQKKKSQYMYTLLGRTDTGGWEKLQVCKLRLQVIRYWSLMECSSKIYKQGIKAERRKKPYI